MAPSSNQKYKIKLSSGRVLGPIGLDRIRLLILKDQITGVEIAREHPVGEWVDINTLGPIADLLVARARGSLASSKPEDKGTHQGTTRMLSGPASTVVALPGRSLYTKTDPEPAKLNARPDPEPKTEIVEEDERTYVASPPREEGEKGTEVGTSVSENTMVPETRLSQVSSVELEKQIQKATHPGFPQKSYPSGSKIEPPPADAPVSEQQTVMLQNPHGKEQWGIADAIKDPRKLQGAIKNSARDLKKQIVGILATLSVVVVVYNLIDMGDAPDPNANSAWTPIRATIPKFDSTQKDPSKSAKYYSEALKVYVMDNVLGYKRAAELLTHAVQYDNSNVKALAMLASTYLNLIDSSNKDENYFAVISKLIELSRANNNDLPETVIADVEFYITVNKAEAAQNRIVEYTKAQASAPRAELFFYLALAFYNRGDAQSAVRYISQYPENLAFSPKLFYLRGQIAEKLGDPTAAIQEYEKAIKMSSNHAKSRLAIARILDKTGQLQSAGAHLDFIARHPRLLAPKDLARADYLHAELHQLYRKEDIAIDEIRRAARLDPGNHEYLLALYSLEAKRGENTAHARSQGRMYYFLGEGEKYLKDDKYHEALTQFMQALQVEGKSPLPHIYIGDMYRHQNDLTHALDSYQKAAELAPNDISVWSKYIDALIQSYDWTKAMTAMDRFRRMDVPQSALDKAAADLYAKQGDYVQARQFYQKAMARDSIDSGVYIAYAKTLMELRDYKEAPFFFALAMRFDPLNVDALVGTAKCVAATESIDRAISLLQDELQKGSVARAELLAAIADFYIQKGSWPQAEQYVDQALTANPDYAYPFKLRARIYLNRETERGMLDKALDAFSSYSDRNISDPSGYLERYRIFVKKGEFEKADDELRKIYAIYPKYPNLHYYKGALYSIMGNAQRAIDEFKIELENNPNSVATLIAMGKEMVKGGAAVKAIDVFNKAMQLSPKSAEAKGEAAYAAYLVKNYYGSVALFGAAVRLDPGNALIYKRMGFAYRDMGDRANASQAFQKYLELDPDAPDRVELESYR